VVNGDGAFPLGRDPPAQAVLFLDRFMIIEETDQIVMHVFGTGERKLIAEYVEGEELTLCAKGRWVNGRHDVCAREVGQFVAVLPFLEAIPKELARLVFELLRP
jgi:hypothetical protein